MNQFSFEKNFTDYEAVLWTKQTYENKTEIVGIID